MGDVIRKKILFYDMVSLVLTLLLCVLLLYAVKYTIGYQGDEREIRVKINQLLTVLQSEKNQTLSVRPENAEQEFPYCVFDYNGTVTASTMEGYPIGQNFDLSTVGTNQYYMTPIVREQKVVGLLLVDSFEQKKNILKNLLRMEAAAAFLVFAAICLIRCKVHRIIQKDIWNPVREIHKSTKKILGGSFGETIAYDYQGQIGTLCHDFEKMRDELRDGALREQESREKERVLYASISHDLKTPLAIITGYLEQILYGVVNTQEQILKTTELALAKVQVLNKLTEDILEHSKAQMNQLNIQKCELYADDFFEKLMESYQREAVLQDYRFICEKPPKVFICIDPDRIAEVVQNIIGNSVKYRKENCTIQVKFEIIEKPQRFLVVSISDDGKGIEASDLPFVFDLFYRGNKARTQNVPGSGMGLNISRYIIEQHGGRIECDSVAGVGTTLSFSIPVI